MGMGHRLVCLTSQTRFGTLNEAPETKREVVHGLKYLKATPISVIQRPDECLPRVVASFY